MGIAELEFWGLIRMAQRIGSAADAVDLFEVGHLNILRDAKAHHAGRQEVGLPHFVPADDGRRTDEGDRLEREFAAVGVEVVYFPYTVHTSSTALRRALDSMSGSERGEFATVAGR